MKQITVGIDEVGRGPLAGPLVVCGALQVKKLPSAFLAQVGDSKKITELKRALIAKEAKQLKKEGCLDFAIVRISPGYIDRHGMTVSLRKAVAKVLQKLSCDPKCTEVLLDGSLYAPSEYKKQRTIIKGDEKEKLIGLASVIAKVDRDAYMVTQAKKYPEYGFEKHKGYGTKEHREAIRKYGQIPLHRALFCRNI